MWSISNYLKYSVLVLFAIIVTMGTVSAAASVFISPESNSVSAGETFNVDVNINSGVDQLLGVHVQIDYEPTALEVVSITEEDLFINGALLEPMSGDDGEGTINYGFVIPDDNSNYASGSGTLISIEFKAKDIAEDGIYNINLDDIRLKDVNKNDLEGTATGSSVVVGNVSEDSSSGPVVIDFGPAEIESNDASSSSTTMQGSDIDTEQQLSYEYIFGSHPDDYQKLLSRGIVPNEDEWNQNLLILESKVKKGLEDENHLFSRGKIISVGANSGGYLVIVFYEPLMVEGEEVDEIYEIVRQKASEINVSNAPVEFGEGTVPEASTRLRDLLQKVQTMNDMEFESLMDNESSLYDPEIIAVAGVVPEIDNEKECWEWYFQDSYMISRNISDSMNEYLQNGTLLNTGLSTYGYFEVTINEEADIDRKSLIADVYEIIDKEAMDVGITNVPVAFKVGNSDVENVVEEDMLVSPEDEVIDDESGTMESEEQQVPGFSIFISLLSLSVVYYMKAIFSKRKS